MSSFIGQAINPKTGMAEGVEFIDDYFGRHMYGVRFKDGTVYRENEITCEAIAESPANADIPSTEPRK